jgi:hypothetical protein
MTLRPDARGKRKLHCGLSSLRGRHAAPLPGFLSYPFAERIGILTM